MLVYNVECALKGPLDHGTTFMLYCNIESFVTCEEKLPVARLVVKTLAMQVKLQRVR